MIAECEVVWITEGRTQENENLRHKGLVRSNGEELAYDLLYDM